MIRRLVDKTSLFACLLILLAFTFAGLSPFHAPPNGARWIGTHNGLRFQGEGVVVSDRDFSAGNPARDECSIEVWLQSALNGGSSTILDFHQLNPIRKFVVRQDGNPILQLLQSGPTGSQTMELAHTFFPDTRRLITVSSGSHGTTLYMDAVAAKSSSDIGSGSSICSGQLSLGAAAISYDYWNGDILGIAVFNSALTETQVKRDFLLWSTQGRLNLNPTESPVALYTFSERSGNIVHNEVAGGPDLRIPPTFQVPDHPFLENPWSGRYAQRVDWKDVAINVVGFAPFGFFCFARLHCVRRTKHAGVATLILGGLISLAIEILQWYIPSRDSSIADVLTNVEGTALGIMLYRFSFRWEYPAELQRQ